MVDSARPCVQVYRDGTIVAPSESNLIVQGPWGDFLTPQTIRAACARQSLVNVKEFFCWKSQEHMHQDAHGICTGIG